MLNKCGGRCADCPFHKDQCAGCDEIKGRVFWAPEFGAEVCPMYACCDGRGYRHCGYCEEMPCSVHKDNKDPSITDEEHAASIAERTRILKEDAGR